MSHLPDAHEDQDDALSEGPPEDLRVGAVADGAETLLSHLRTQQT